MSKRTIEDWLKDTPALETLKYFEGGTHCAYVVPLLLGRGRINIVNLSDPDSVENFF